MKKSPVIVLLTILSIPGCYVADKGGALLTALTNDSSSTTASTSGSTGLATTTLGTRGAASKTNTPITGNAGGAWKGYSRSAEYPNAITLPLQFITTTSGDTLAVLVSVPADSNGKQVPGQFPVILTQTAYRIDMANFLGTIAPSETTLMIGGRDNYMIKRGYITVAVDVRGAGMSSGVTSLLGAEEQADYADAVNWVTQQSWFDGNLGLAGTSYLGITSLLTAEQQNSVIKAIFAVVPMGDAYRGTVVPGGMINAVFINDWFMITQNLTVANLTAELFFPKYASRIAAATKDHVASLDEWYFPTINAALNDETGYSTDDGNFWALRSPIENAKKIKVPTFIIGGTNDLFQRCEPLLYEQMKNNVTTKLMIFPGAHLEAVFDAMFAQSNAFPGSEAAMLQWFDHYLKGMDTGTDSIPNVTQYVEGYGKTFASATDWPHPKASPQRFYLHGSMGLDNQAPAANEPSHALQEPAAPVMNFSAIGGTDYFGTVAVKDGSDCSSSAVQWSLGIAGLVPLACYADNATVDKHGLVYETSPLASDLYINGPMQADIWMSATRPHAALAVRISLVDGSGTATPISTGIQSAAFRAVDTSRSRYVNGVMVQPWHPFTAASMQPLTPNEPVLVPVEIFPGAVLIKAGHRLRISITASNQEEGLWPLPKQSAVNGNVSTIYNDPQHPSSLVVLTVPTSELK